MRKMGDKVNEQQQKEEEEKNETKLIEQKIISCDSIIINNHRHSHMAKHNLNWNWNGIINRQDVLYIFSRKEKK